MSMKIDSDECNRLRRLRAGLSVRGRSAAKGAYFVVDPAKCNECENEDAPHCQAHLSRQLF